MPTGVLADANNLGAKRMAMASEGANPQEIAWKRIFNTRPETSKLAQAGTPTSTSSILMPLRGTMVPRRHPTGGSFKREGAGFRYL